MIEIQFQQIQRLLKVVQRKMNDHLELIEQYLDE